MSYKPSVQHLDKVFGYAADTGLAFARALKLRNRIGVRRDSECMQIGTLDDLPMSNILVMTQRLGG